MCRRLGSGDRCLTTTTSGGACIHSWIARSSASRPSTSNKVREGSQRRRLDRFAIALSQRCWWSSANVRRGRVEDLTAIVPGRARFPVRSSSSPDRATTGSRSCVQNNMHIHVGYGVVGMVDRRSGSSWSQVGYFANLSIGGTRPGTITHDRPSAVPRVSSEPSPAAWAGPMDRRLVAFGRHLSTAPNHRLVRRVVAGDRQPFGRDRCVPNRRPSRGAATSGSERRPHRTGSPGGERRSHVVGALGGGWHRRSRIGHQDRKVRLPDRSRASVGARRSGSTLPPDKQCGSRTSRRRCRSETRAGSLPARAPNGRGARSRVGSS